MLIRYHNDENKMTMENHGSDDTKVCSTFTTSQDTKRESVASKRVSVTSCGVVLKEENEHSLT